MISKLLKATLLILILLLITLVYRAVAVFENRQVAPSELNTDVAIDEQAAVRRFSGAIGYPTVSHDDRSRFDRQAFLDFHRYLEESYPLVHQRLVRTVVNDYSLVYQLRGTDPSLEPVLFMGHMDVVPIDPVTREQWTHEPFSGVVADGKIWGRGSLDDKLSVITLLEAMELLLSEGKQAQRSIFLAFGHDEEVGGADGAARIADWFSRQGIRFDFVLDEGGFVTEDILDSVEHPVAIIGVAEKGWVNLELLVKAPGGHSSQPPDHTAVGILSSAIVTIENNPFPSRLDYMMMTIDEIAADMPFRNRFFLANTWLFSPLIKASLIEDPGKAATLRTTAAATVITGSPKSNILPTRASAIVNFRILPGESGESVRERVVGLIDDERVQVTMQSNWNPSAVAAIDSEAFRTIAGAIRAFDPEILVAPYLVQGGTDARYFYPMSDNIYRFIMARVNPQTIQIVHGIDEHVAVEEFQQAIRFYYLLMARAAM
jgi:carboxypeptidase PM20D1